MGTRLSMDRQNGPPLGPPFSPPPIFNQAGIVTVGYVGAFAIAWVIVKIYISATGGPDRQTYGVMFDFGDSLLFLGVFGLAAVPATAAALFFLRPRPAFWLTLSVAALVVATTSVAAFLVQIGPRVFS